MVWISALIQLGRIARLLSRLFLSAGILKSNDIKTESKIGSKLRKALVARRDRRLLNHNSERLRENDPNQRR